METGQKRKKNAGMLGQPEQNQNETQTDFMLGQRQWEESIKIKRLVSVKAHI